MERGIPMRSLQEVRKGIGKWCGLNDGLQKDISMSYFPEPGNVFLFAKGPQRYN